MALLNSFNSGVAGIKTFSKSLEVIGDNIANVNSTGFKTSRVTNQDSFIETMRPPTAANGNAGGLNGMQVGMGSSVASISQKFTQGALTTTAGPTDLGISGNGFFKVTDSNQNTFYTRAGDFRLDELGTLRTTGGMLVAGADEGAFLNAKSFSFEKDGTINVYKEGSATPVPGGTLELVSFANPNGLKREGQNLFSNIALAAGDETPVPAGSSNIIQGTLELSNVDLTQEFSDLIVAQRAFQANSRVITVSDSVMEEVVNLKR
jgi:flagellar hook protein FlgE